jgi:hypothetical protein
VQIEQVLRELLRVIRIGHELDQIALGGDFEDLLLYESIIDRVAIGQLDVPLIRAQPVGHLVLPFEVDDVLSREPEATPHIETVLEVSADYDRRSKVDTVR